MISKIREMYWSLMSRFYSPEEILLKRIGAEKLAVIAKLLEPKAQPFKPAECPEVVHAVTALVQGRFPDLDARLAALPEGLRYRTIDRMIAVRSEDATGTGWMKPFADWVAAAPSCESCYAMGRAHIVMAWKYRGRRAASSVAEEMWPLFFEQLAFAERSFDRAYGLDRKCAEPLAGLLVCYRAQQGVPPQKIQRCFEVMSQIAPFNYMGNMALLECLKEKWGGSHDQMFGFARHQSQAAPEGEAVHALIAEAHLEMWATLNWTDEEEAADAYFKSPDVQAELVEAWRKSGAVPAFHMNENYLAICNLFTGLFHMTGDKARTREALAGMNNVYTERPWEYLAQEERERDNYGRMVDRVAREAADD